MSILLESFSILDFLEGGGVVVRALSRHGGPKFGKGVRRPNIRRHVVRLGVDGLHVFHFSPLGLDVIHFVSAGAQ